MNKARAKMRCRAIRKEMFDAKQGGGNGGTQGPVPPISASNGNRAAYGGCVVPGLRRYLSPIPLTSATFPALISMWLARSPYSAGVSPNFRPFFV